MVADDGAHGKAKQVMAGLARERRPLITTDHVIAETLTLLKARGAVSHCHRFDSLVRRTLCMEIQWTDTELFKAAKQLFLDRDDQGYSFTGCLSFVVMRLGALAEALTTDHRFRAAGFQPLL